MRVTKNEKRVVIDARGEISWEEIVLHARRQFAKAIGLPKEELNNIGVYASKADIGYGIKLSYDPVKK